MKWLENLQKTFTGLKMRRKINKLLRILYFEFKDLMERAKKRKTQDISLGICGDLVEQEKRDPNHTYEYGVYYDSENDITKFIKLEDEKSSEWTYLGSIEEMVAGDWQYFAPPSDAGYIPVYVLQSIVRKCNQLSYERDLYFDQKAGKPTKRLFKYYAIPDGERDMAYKVFERGMYDDFVCDCVSEYYAQLIVDNLNEKFNRETT